MGRCQVSFSQETLLNMFQTYTSQFREERYSTYSSELMHMLASSITRMNWQSFPVSKERPCSPLDLPVVRDNTVSPTAWATLAHIGMMVQEETMIPAVPMAITVRMHLKFIHYSLLCLLYVQAGCLASLRAFRARRQPEGYIGERIAENHGELWIHIPIAPCLF